MRARPRLLYHTVTTRYVCALRADPSPRDAVQSVVAPRDNAADGAVEGRGPRENKGSSERVSTRWPDCVLQV